jgi:hypothetical protein
MEHRQFIVKSHVIKMALLCCSDVGLENHPVIDEGSGGQQSAYAGCELSIAESVVQCSLVYCLSTFIKGDRKTNCSEIRLYPRNGAHSSGLVSQIELFSS